MKKIYRRKGTVHPSPPSISDHLTLLPATILTLAAALSPPDREVLAYLISSSSSFNFSLNERETQKNNTTTTTSTGGGKSGDHPTSFGCNCFRCYTSYWARWDSSPNRQLIHEIIDAFEEGVSKKENSIRRRERRPRRGVKGSSGHDELNRSDQVSSSKEDFRESCLDLVEVTGCSGGGGGGGGGGGEGGDSGGEAEEGSVRKLVSFIGERFWSVWTLGK